MRKASPGSHALGSVRQLTSQSGQVTYAKSYDPYGGVTQTSGAGQSAYGYTGEQQNGDMVYLRARYYSPLEGRFLSRDTWDGDARRPMSMNRWGYVEGNPISRVDPTGLLASNGTFDLLACFDLHSGSHGVYGGGNGTVVLVSAQEAVNICKRAYSPNSWDRSSFNLNGNLPKSGRDLFGWFLFNGSGSLVFDASEPLTQELSKSRLINNIRFWASDSLTPMNTWREYKFNAPEQAQCLADFFHAPKGSYPLTCVLGSFNYQVKILDDGESVGFRIDNRTDLESGTHVAFRFPPEYSGSVEDLLDRRLIQDDTPLISVIANDKFNIISILDGSKGANLVQTYVWKEKRDPCQFMNWNYFVEPATIDTWEKNGNDGYGTLTVSPY